MEAKIANDSCALFLCLSDLLDSSLEWVSLGLVVTGWFGCTKEVFPKYRGDRALIRENKLKY